MRRLDKLSNPWLVIHNSKNYRLSQTDGIGALHALKQCTLSHAAVRSNNVDDDKRGIERGSSVVRATGFEQE